MKKQVVKKKKETVPSDYDAFKVFEGQYYKGMKVGGHHKWRYAPGEWKETKRTPDLWEFQFRVKKRRAGKAPEGSGVPLGTEYNWAILASQTVKKLDANTYETEMHGIKYKVAYKKAGKEKWSVTERGQRTRMIGFLRNVLLYLEEEEKKALELKKKKKLTVKKTRKTT